MEPLTRHHVESMVSKLTGIDAACPRPKADSIQTAGYGLNVGSSPFLVICALDLVNLLEALYPCPTYSPTQWDAFLNSSAAAFAAQYPPVSRLEDGSSLARHSRGHSSIDSRMPTFTTALNSGRVPGPYGRSQDKFEQLRRDLSAAIERGATLHSSHPIQEDWVTIPLGPEGFPAWQEMDKAVSQLELRSQVSAYPAHERGVQCTVTTPEGIVQKAAMRLVHQHRGVVSSPRANIGGSAPLHPESSLESLFQNEAQLAQDRTDTSEAHYWFTALKDLRTRYPLCVLSQNDTKILQPLLQTCHAGCHSIESTCAKLEDSLAKLKETFDHLKDATQELCEQMDTLRDKMWYMVDITNSDRYEDARNVALTLTNMAVQAPDSHAAAPISRGRASLRFLAGSFLQHQQAQTMNIMKAPSDQGGPKKLADEQIEMTRKWLQRSAIDNFCRGEERIHRFCLEIKLATRRFVGETINESPVLWSSDLYKKERAQFDGANFKPSAISLATRPSSVTSEENPLALQQLNPGYRPSDMTTRAPTYETQSSPGRKGSFHSFGSSRPGRDFLNIDTYSLGGSPSRAVSTSTAESISSFWSSAPTQAQSSTSVSSQSGPPSAYNDVVNQRSLDSTAHSKTRFLDKLRQNIVSLLLSDLGSPVWSCGSETDAWLDDVLKHESLKSRIVKRENVERLLSEGRSAGSATPRHSKMSRLQRRQTRSTSVEPCPVSNRISENGLDAEQGQQGPLTGIRYANSLLAVPDHFPYVDGFKQILDSFCRQTCPTIKLQILHDLKDLTTSFMREKSSRKSTQEHSSGGRKGRMGSSVPSSRRSSLNPSVSKSDEMSSQPPSAGLSEGEIVQELKRILMEHRPRTLFRDLQFISAFVSGDVLDKSQEGKAFLLVGLAALAYKEDVCRSMVDVADKIVANDIVKRRARPETTVEYTLIDAAQFWILAAREGNAVAQRELATLYLTHPEHLPLVSLPLSLPRETFKMDKMFWQHQGTSTRKVEAMCLALHWMQHAASNGDEIAKRKLEDRRGLGSLH